MHVKEGWRRERADDNKDANNTRSIVHDGQPADLEPGCNHEPTLSFKTQQRAHRRSAVPSAPACTTIARHPRTGRLSANSKSSSEKPNVSGALAGTAGPNADSDDGAAGDGPAAPIGRSPVAGVAAGVVLAGFVAVVAEVDSSESRSVEMRGFFPVVAFFFTGCG